MSNLIKFTSIERPRQAGDTGVMSKRGVRLKAFGGPVYPQGTAATKTIGTSNAAVLVTAREPGAWANTFVKFGIIVSGNSTPFSLTSTYSSAGVLSITINAQTDSGGLSLTTATVAAAAINADPIATKFVVATAGGTGATVIVAGAVAALTSGANSGQPESLWIRATNDATVVCDITDGLTAKLVRRNNDRLVSLGNA